MQNKLPKHLQQSIFLETFYLPTTGFNSSVSLTGQTSTQLMHVEHSSEITVLTLSTLINDGHAFAHKLQSMHDSLFLLIFSGLKIVKIPNNAP